MSCIRYGGGWVADTLWKTCLDLKFSLFSIITVRVIKPIKPFATNLSRLSDFTYKDLLMKQSTCNSASADLNPVYPRWTPSKTFRIPFILIQPRSTLFILVPSHSTSFILIHTTHDYHPHTLLNTVNPLLIPFKLIISSATNSTFTRRSVGLKYSAMIFVANLETRMLSTLEIPVWFTRY